MLLKPSLLLVLLGCQIVLPYINVRGQNSRVFADRIKCSIVVESNSLSRRKPSYVLIQIENISDNDIDFRARYSFYLKSKVATSPDYSRRGDSYWSPAGIVNKEGQFVIVPHALKAIKPGESYQLPNDLVLLRKGETKLIKVDLTQFPWNDRILSGWPTGNSFAHIPKGSYFLEFEIKTNKEEVKSNQVEVSLD